MFLFIPLGTTRPRWRVPYCTYGLIGANVIVFLLQLGYPEAMPAGFVPNHPSLLMWIASMFMHGGLLHLGGNMLFLWLFCTLAEDVFGAWVMLGFYFGGDLAATLLHALMGALFAPDSLSTPVVGASGAIAGIMGLSAVCFLRTKVRVWYLVGLYLYWRTNVVEIAAPVFLGLWAGWEVVQGLVSTAVQATYGGGGGVAHWAHVGGFGAGLAVALGLRLRKRVVHTDLVEGRRGAETKYEAFAQAGELEKMVRESPEDADSWYALGRAWEMSGRGNKAAEAFGRALMLFLRTRRGTDAVRACRALREYGDLPALSDDLMLRLGGALEEEGHRADALAVLRQLALGREAGPYTETALIRAGQIARSLRGHELEAAHCYREYLRQFPHGQWQGRAVRALRELGAEEAAGPGDSDERRKAAGDAGDPDLRQLGDFSGADRD